MHKNRCRRWRKSKGLSGRSCLHSLPAPKRVLGWGAAPRPPPLCPAGCQGTAAKGEEQGRAESGAVSVHRGEGARRLRRAQGHGGVQRGQGAERSSRPCGEGAVAAPHGPGAGQGASGLGTELGPCPSQDGGSGHVPGRSGNRVGLCDQCTEFWSFYGWVRLYLRWN